MCKYDFTIFGCGASVHLLKTEEFPQEGKSLWINDPDIEILDGGVGLNLCAGLSQIGAKVYPVLSSPDQRLYRKILDHYCKTYNWPTNGIFPPAENSERTCFMFQNSQKEHMTIIYQQGTSEERQFETEEIDRFVSDSKMAIIACPLPENTVSIYKELKKRQIPYALSYRNDEKIYPSAVLKDMLLGATYVFMNKCEALQIQREYDLENVEELFVYPNSQIQVIVVTRGTAGSDIYCRKKDGTIKKESVPICRRAKSCTDTIGAGDAFMAGFLMGCLKNKSCVECAKWGHVMSSFVIEKVGSITNLPTLTELIQREKRGYDFS